ncbi:MAG: DUF4249 family protein [Spirochaetes bacterium]|nr:DUF4249 family protein [Spirochaetota bacterium]
MNINLINTSTTILKAASKKGGYYKKLLCYLIPVSFLIVVFQCESPEVFYRPDLPEKLCSIGIIDLDDTTLRHISFEKSFQSEYPVELNDSLRDFSFLISSSDGELFSYHCDSTVKSINDLKIPDNITFNPGEKYYLYAKERDMEEITAEVIAPESPAEPRLISTTVLNTTLSEPVGCVDTLDVRTILIKISFEKNESLHYAILVRGWGGSTSSDWPEWPGFLDFAVVESNTQGFVAAVQGLVTYHFPCKIRRDPTFAYFIEGEKIQGSECLLTLSVQYRDGFCIFDVIKAIDIKVFSIPGELYLFEKSLYTYGKISGDPFAEPIYINGNIKGGNGIFSLCRSKELKITFSPWISYNPYSSYFKLSDQ